MAVVVTYQYPVAGTVPPVTSQTFNEVNALLTWGDADTTATVTHAFVLSATETAAGFPYVSINQDSTSATGTIYGLYLVSKAAASAIVISKLSAAGSAAALQVQILRPNTSIR
jgi:hypothetical protein